VHVPRLRGGRLRPDRRAHDPHASRHDARGIRRPFRPSAVTRYAIGKSKRQPEGATRAYRLVIDRAPRAVQKALRAA